MIEINKENIIRKCNEYLLGNTSKEEVLRYANELIINDKYEWDDELISKIIYAWDSEKMNYPINKVNMKLWKQWLETGKNKLPEFNSWNSHIEKQKKICGKFDSNWNPVNKKLMIGCSDNLDKEPISGLRRPKEERTTGWLIWSGELSKKDDFFRPVCAEHLLQRRPEIIKYLGLGVGFRFLVKKNGYEDVWFDKETTKLK